MVEIQVSIGIEYGNKTISVSEEAEPKPLTTRVKDANRQSQAKEALEILERATARVRSALQQEIDNG